MKEPVYQERKDIRFPLSEDASDIAALRSSSDKAQAIFMHLSHFEELMKTEDRYIDAASNVLMREYLKSMIEGSAQLVSGKGFDQQHIWPLRQILGFLLSAASDIFEHDKREGYVGGVITTGNLIKQLFDTIQKANEVVGEDSGNKRLQQMSANFAALYAKQLPKQ